MANATIPLPAFSVPIANPDRTPSKTYYDWLTRAQDALQNGRTALLTVNELPSAATIGKGARAFVTDSATSTFRAIVTGASTFSMPVFSDGTNWRIG